MALQLWLEWGSWHFLKSLGLWLEDSKHQWQSWRQNLYQKWGGTIYTGMTSGLKTKHKDKRKKLAAIKNWKTEKPKKCDPYSRRLHAAQSYVQRSAHVKLMLPSLSIDGTLPETNRYSTWKWMVGRWSLPFGSWPIFRGAMLVSGRIISIASENHRLQDPRTQRPQDNTHFLPRKETPRKRGHVDVSYVLLFVTWYHIQIISCYIYINIRIYLLYLSYLYNYINISHFTALYCPMTQYVESTLSCCSCNCFRFFLGNSHRFHSLGFLRLETRRLPFLKRSVLKFLFQSLFHLILLFLQFFFRRLFWKGIFENHTRSEY